MSKQSEYNVVKGVDGKSYIFFWGGWCSQFYKADINIGIHTYNCGEQYMMTEKARLFKDREVFDAILATSNPKEQKALGRKVKNFNQEEWGSVARDVVYRANLAKFTQHADLKEKLLATGDAIIVEASPYDAIWGVKMSADNPDILDPSKWRGTNWLGEEIMKVREEIINSLGDK